MLTASSRIWTLLTVSISFDDIITPVMRSEQKDQYQIKLLILGFDN